jgi:hypothetical protein
MALTDDALDNEPVGGPSCGRQDLGEFMKAVVGSASRSQFEPASGGGVAGQPRALLRSPVAYRLSLLLGVAASAASASAVFVPGILSGPAVAQGNLRGTALIVLVVGMPLLAVSMWFTSKGSARGLVVWVGTVVYIGYQAVMFVFATPFDSLFLVFVGMLSLSIWSLIFLATDIELGVFGRRFGEGLPARRIAIYLAIMAVLNALVWLRAILPAIASPDPDSFLEGSGLITNPVYVQDLAVWLPLMIVGAWWMWNRKVKGYLIVGAMLVTLVLESIGVATDQWFGAMADPDTPFASTSVIPFFLALAVIGCLPLFWYFRHLDRKPALAV